MLIKKDLKGRDLTTFDYILDNFKSFYELADCITVPLSGKFELLIYCNSYKQALEFIDRENEFECFNVTIVLPDKQAISNIALAKPSARIGKGISMFEVFKQEIENRHLVIDKRAVSKLYASIGSSLEEMEEGLSILENTYGRFKLINLNDISKVITLKDLVYPRQVMVAYLTMHKYRKSKLNQAIESFGEDIVFYAIRKNIQKIMEERYQYLRTSIGSDLIKGISTKNINLMYYLFYVRYRDFPVNVRMILHLYENGFKEYDYDDGE